MLKHKKVIVIGCGPHYRKVYHEILEESDIEIALLIDLEDKRDEVLQFFHNKRKNPAATLFLKEIFRNQITQQDIHTLVSSLTDLSSIDAVIISTEPKVRKPYAKWAATQGFDIFMDKPTNAFSHQGEIDKLLNDYDEIAYVALQNKVNVVVSCERRAHLGYGWVKEYLKEFIAEMNVPITFIDIHFGGGVKCSQDEYLTKENHPYKYGYGLLLHSGYHYIDLLVTLYGLNLNKANSVSEEPCCSLKVMCSRLEQFEIASQQKLNHLGETDVLIIGQMQNPVYTNFSLRLLTTSASLRKANQDTSNLEGRIRQEQVIIHLGHLCSVQISSNPFNKLSPDEHPNEHFDITIINSPIVKHQKPFIKLTRSDLSHLFPLISETASLNKLARKWQLKEFLKGNDGNSSFATHRNTVKMLHAIYSEMKREALG